MQKKFVEFVDMNSIALVVVSFVFDNLYPNKVDVRDIVGKGYFYNYFTNKTMIDSYDSMVGFAKIISEECDDFDLLYRLDERLAMPADEYYDYTGVPFAKIRGQRLILTEIILRVKKCCCAC